MKEEEYEDYLGQIPYLHSTHETFRIGLLNCERIQSFRGDIKPSVPCSGNSHLYM